jgi:hypothetical protein
MRRRLKARTINGGRDASQRVNSNGVNSNRVRRWTALVARSLAGFVIAAFLVVAARPIVGDPSKYQPAQDAAWRPVADASQTPSHILRGSATLVAHGALARSTQTLVPAAITAVDASTVRVAAPRKDFAARAADVTELRGYDAAAPPFLL